MSLKLLKYLIVIELLCVQIMAVNSLTDSEMSLASHARRGEFVLSPDIRKLVEWADIEGIYVKCGVEDIANIHLEDRSALIADIKQMLNVSGSTMDRFIASLKDSGLDEITANKVLLILYAYLRDSQ